MRKKFVRAFPALKHMNIPNAITTLGLVFGIFACYFLTQQNLRMAIVFLTIASIMDFVDGFVAAKLKQQTEFGQYVDTLVDFFTCGIIPVWMVFDLLVRQENTLFANILIICALVFYCMCALWRLAYYNIIEADKFFTGLPVPGAMMIVTMAVWCVVRFEFIPVLFAAIVFFTVGTLMISGIILPKYGMWQKIMSAIAIPFLALVLFY
ncbi:MAG: CDP-alcohol phosphatidyltransferase family protein [Clostridiales bacterium]|jgi:CDP-diacylglycerol--serine O-phosphatidyltransferase|nr:CDP-alcohol phosphatidyltransferase family protein [Clostridiales bacterium]